MLHNGYTTDQPRAPITLGAVRKWGAAATKTVVTPYGAASEQVTQDVNTRTYAGEVYDVGASMIPLLGQSSFYASSNPAVATVSEAGVVSRVSSGAVTISALGLGTSESHSVSVSRVTNPNTVLGLSWKSGTLGHHCASQVSALIAGKAPSLSTLRIFSSASPISSYTRNGSCWLDGVDMTCISGGNSVSGFANAGTVITPRHILYANHYQLSVGCTMAFVTSGNEIVTRTLAASARVTSPVNGDVQIGRLDSDLPGTITPVKIVPNTLLSYLPTLATTNGTFPLSFLSTGAIMTNQAREVIPCSLFGVHYASGVKSYAVSSLALFPNDPDCVSRSLWGKEIIGGDSGSPIFLLINGELALLGHAMAGGTGAGGPVSASYDIDATIAALGSSGGHTVSMANLSGFESF